MMTATSAATSSRNNQRKSVDGDFIRFSDLLDPRVVVIHTGEQANSKGTIRATLQRAHNEAMEENNPIDAELEPELSLYVSPSQLDEPVKLYKMADKDSTKRIVVHQLGALPVEKSKRLAIELRRQAPGAGIYLGQQGESATPWGIVDLLDIEQQVAITSTGATLRAIDGGGYEPPSGPAATIPDGFQVENGMLCVWDTVGRGDSARQELIPLSSPIWVMAETEDERGGGYGRLLEWQDSAGRVRHWAMPMRALVPRNGEEVFSSLLAAGLPFIDLPRKSKLTSYLMACRPERRITCVELTGWHGGSYVLPGEVIGGNADGVILQTAGYAVSDFAERGELTDWKQGVSALAVDNSRLCFALSLAFAAPLLSLVGMEGGGFHLKGESTDGKTTIMRAAASVYGNPTRYMQTWRATGNAIEGIASRRNDALLCLDELGELDGREAGQTAYMLANGQGKGRSKQDGELRERKAWRLLFLSTGELSLEDHAASSGKRTQAGMEVRTIQIPSDTGRYGAFEQLHGMADGRTFADELKSNSDAYHGAAFRAYVEALANDIEGHAERLKAEIKRLAAEFTPKGAGNQVGRAINRFALVAAAGELATALGVTGWPEGEAIRAARVCLKSWLAERGHIGNHEDAATLAQVRGFVTAHQFTRFADWFNADHRPANMVGYRKAESDGVSFFVLPPGWAEITKGRDPKRAATLCLEAGYLRIGKDKRRLQYKARLPGMSSAVWAYLLTERVLADEAEGQEDE